MKELTGSRSENPLPTVTKRTNLGDKFADHFMGKIDKIRESLKDFENFEPATKKVPRSDVFKELTHDENKTSKGQLQTKSSELDVFPTKVLKGFLNELLPSITRLVNLSLAQGVFPKSWKRAIVRPLLKKSGLELTFTNYCPVSNLSFLSKLIEKAVLYRLNQHVNENNLLPKNQPAYKQFHSCGSVLLRLVNYLLDEMEHREVTALIAIDLSATFDTVDHDILINVLRSQYGVCRVALDLVDSYLRPRSCCVKVNKTVSSQRNLKCHVPQGSCLIAWLYLTYRRFSARVF